MDSKKGLKTNLKVFVDKKTIEEKIAEVDIISCATLSKTPLILGKFLKTGQHIDLVGSYKTDMREADDETIEILYKTTEEEGPFPGLIHCFSTDKKVADCALELGFYISISGIITFKNADNLRDIVRTIPLERLLIETDAPFLAPVPKRGRTNEPSFIPHTAKMLANLFDLDSEELGKITSNNFFKLFTKAHF